MRICQRDCAAMILIGLAVLMPGCSRGGSPRWVSPVKTVTRPLSTVPTMVRAGRKVELGEFEVTGSRLFASDPAYAEPSADAPGLMADLKNVRAGTWRATAINFEAGPKDVRCAELVAYHKSHFHPESCKWKPQESVVGVDSGQAGFFDPKYAQNSSVVPKDYHWHQEIMDPENRWYSLCCDMTLSDKQAGVIPFGVVASSGYGDGGYACFTCLDKDGKVQGVRMVFISQEDLESN